MNKHYKLIVGHDFSLSNETDGDIQSDYFPGIWGIKTQKSALRFAKQELAEGNTISITDYDNPKYHSLANWFIKELGINQPLFKEPEQIKSTDTKGMPANLAQLKAYCKVDTSLRTIVYNDAGEIIKENTTRVLSVQTTSITVEKTAGTGIHSWIEWGKASEWGFYHDKAIQYFLNKNGEQKPSLAIIYK